ncbi:MAG: DitF protein [Rhodobiaceae bacterium]|jgi:acetyl-CoA acetyltransferase|nr:DitF protein [Rhodobiaceae bacterium]RPF97639.1 MAG: thiolase family protein [Rhizobiales bacterium TMED227]|tara:strand:- start:2437 stop:3579 length:1143 start_codon:yes stop_codon:yes gene_type:complete
MFDPKIIGVGQSEYTRHPSESQTVQNLMRDATNNALNDANLSLKDIDGLAIASFSITPDSAIDIAWRFGLSLNWLLQDTNGGSSAMNMLGHAMRAVQTGAAKNILILAGDATGLAGYAKIANAYNSATRDHLSPLGHGGPNGVYSLVTTRQMKKFNLQKEDYANLLIAQRNWASMNPHAVYKSPLSKEEYINAPIVAGPLCRYDCVPVIAGSYALILSRNENDKLQKQVRVKAFQQSFNYDNQEGDGTETGIITFKDNLYGTANLAPQDIDVYSIYDDYPAIVLAQLNDLGLIKDSDIKNYLQNMSNLDIPLNTWGGMLSAGQPGGMAGGLNGIGEVALQLQNRANDRQVNSAKYGIVTGYGMTLYRHGGTVSAAILEGF